ncbi:MAG: hypothetical protein A2268_03790 [Candidatus Raymondbacteria bacterium RifOxyA12_full_50_37]|uniref:HTH araC/xylS-type domain-containing protein n=1 Tax=Candidatus Raymondbacteria bacterium RIFOXYD12_FULL_49_13 TaxID=1817890 RepID=A0A1F7F4Q1_UNCRA|nr:MAG: hypothetical protein A2350_03560 [Candidatus Raymondbacteria bacterium RifOxyB12_full_50_8]OGJ90565.1 MAG: hypothetical protein A2268_03790 [Candidatus Raymondbacteria bacterium RifOxyA12_full_50_37]OGJ91914.1 MAG: hypothetical protein A2248_04860 [Candidatus Raymondbacteria bacterium RIFOXYA2_FULL_49_16]OGJ98048.1 MAG: hypothetical protein A2453_12160 [Candidatus Raymondbacteria bacterium RIFOXYC2_FULL_50_21]OGK00796.1 MAG: hypothetical protein A2487_04945 [Candidatus Raymondbacteria b
MDRKNLFNQRRILIPLYRYGIYDIEVLGRLNYSRAAQPLRTHVHHGGLEICYLARGRQVYSVGDRQYRLTGGDVFITLPDEAHGTGRMPEEKSVLYWLVVRFSGRNRSFLGLPDKDGAELRHALLGMRHRHFKGSPTLCKILNDIVITYHTKGMPLKTAYLRNKIVEFLIMVVACARSGGVIGKNSAMQGLLDFINGRITEKMTVPDLARAVGLSASWLKAKFKQETGIPIAEYVLRKKIDLAKELLKKGEKNVTEAAFDLDFSSSQYFATVFKRYTGKKPGEWKHC